LQHIKASKYTVEIKFRPTSIEEFDSEIIQSKFLEREPMGKRRNFYFAEQIEKQLGDFYADEELFKVAMVNFVYKNQRLLTLLKQRGKALKWRNKLDLKRINKLITV